jgi:(p)ppGpp synthase/HD superfamily hydrolase
MSDEMLFDAIEFACKAHRGQVRKGTRVPYVFHPLGVGRSLLDAGFDDEIVVAGFLHDTVEDTHVTIEEIALRFGERVASIVAAVSEGDKTETWEKRKEETIMELETAAVEVLAVACADKLDNIRSIHADLDRIGDSVWKRFKRPRESQEWYYRSLARVFGRKMTSGRLSSFSSSFSSEVEAVFGKAGRDGRV